MGSPVKVPPAPKRVYLEHDEKGYTLGPLKNVISQKGKKYFSSYLLIYFKSRYFQNRILKTKNNGNFKVARISFFLNKNVIYVYLPYEGQHDLFCITCMKLGFWV